MTPTPQIAAGHAASFSIAPPAERRPGGRIGIAGVRQQIETQFLRVGSNLETLAMGLAALEDPLATLVDMRGHVWVSIETRLTDLDAKLDALELAFRQYSEMIGALVETAGALGPDIAQVSRTVRAMKIVTLNGRVAASAVSIRDDGLEVFTTAAGQLIAAADETTGAVREQIDHIVANTRVTFDAAFARGRGELSHARAAVAKVRAFVAEVAAPGAGEQDFGETLQARVQGLKRGLADASTAMQAGDRVRQRLEHVEELREGSATPDRAWLQALATDLLKGAVDDFVAEAADIEHGLRDILLRSRQLAASGGTGRGVLETGDVETTLDAVRGIQASLEVLVDVRTVFGTLIASLSKDYEQFDKAFRGIGEIEARMHFVGLNAAITCSRLGAEGAALREVARQLSALSGEIAQLFAGVKGRVADVEGHFRALSGDLSGRPRALIDEMEGSSRDLLDALSGVFEKWGQVRREMGAVQAQLDDRTPRDLRAITEMAATLKSVGSLPQEVLAPTEVPPSDAAMAAAFARYSMDGERDIHRAFCARHMLDVPAEATNHAVPSAEAEQALDDIFF